MFRWISKLQQRPEAARRRASFSIALVVTVIIFIIWLVSLPVRLPDVRERQQAVRAPSPIAAFRDSVQGLMNTLGGTLFSGEE